MKEIDDYLKHIKSSKSPIKEALVIANYKGADYLIALLNRALEVRDLKTAQYVFSSIRLTYAHELNLKEIEYIEKENGLTK